MIAGAGSGKTRVLVHRVAWLIQIEGVSPNGLMAVTFTNKAAAEMRSRIEELLNMSGQTLWVGTFHGLAHRLLRMHWQEAGLPQNFQILDADDQLRLVKRIMRDQGIDEQKWPARQAVWFINSQKDEGKRSKEIPVSDDLFQITHKKIYENYERLCNQGGLVDFAELLLRSHELWLENPSLLRHYQERFQSILVDEFQDTNGLQMDLLMQLVGPPHNVCVVGDDDQSIYGWRGAQVSNILQFGHFFPNPKVVRLENNYRSTEAILRVANALIHHSPARHEKSLRATIRGGEKVALMALPGDEEEALWMAKEIRRSRTKENRRWEDFAVLFRTNTHIRKVEQVFRQEAVSYTHLTLPTKA